jgi:hypothetical protein
VEYVTEPIQLLYSPNRDRHPSYPPLFKVTKEHHSLAIRASGSAMISPREVLAVATQKSVSLGIIGTLQFRQTPYFHGMEFRVDGMTISRNTGAIALATALIGALRH